MHRDSRYQSLLALTISAILILTLMFGSCASAQTVTGSIYGTVADTSGAVIPNASVTVTNVDTGETHTALSTGAGTYVFPVLNPGNYKVGSVSAGFTTVIQTSIRLAANQNVNVSFALKAGAVQTTVTVQADTTLVDTRESTISTTIDQGRIQDLPLVGRSAYDLVALVPGITNYTAPAQIGDVNGAQFSANGLAGDYNSFYLDGSFNTEFYRGGGNILPNPDALAEFSILTSNQDAEFGRDPGAVVNVITRSGSNQFHGVAYDFLRNADITAKNYFATSVAPLVYNVFGAGGGGPAIGMPILKDKLFFYLNYQGTRIHTPAVITTTSIVVPSALERQGNFSQSTKVPTKTGCATGVNPVAPATICIDPVAAATLKYVPAAINAANNPAQQSAPANTQADQGVARLDYQLNAAHNLQFTFFQSRGTRLNPNQGGNQILDFTNPVLASNQSNYIVGDTWTMSSHAVNSFRFSYTLNRTLATPSAGGRLADLGSTIPEGDSLLNTQPQFNISGYYNQNGQGDNTNQAQLMYGISDIINYSKGRHTAKFGGEVTESRYQETNPYYGSTITSFNGSFSGNALADFMEGHANSFTQNTGVYHRTHALDPSLFAQDDWHIMQRLTLDLGVRWEVFYPLHGQSDTGTFVPGVQSTRFPTAPVGLLSAGDPGVPDGVLHVVYDRFAPRVGFAYDPFGTGRLSVRGSYGIFYAVNRETLSGNLVQQPFSLQIGLSSTTSLVNPYTGIAPYNGVSPFGPNLNPAKNPTFAAGASLDGLRPYTASTPYVQEYNLTVQQQLGSNWSLQIGYVGNVARKFYHPIDENAPIYAAGASTANANIQSRRPYQPEGSITEYVPSNNMNYNSLQATLTKQFAHNFSLLASYVWSKNFDIADVSPQGGAAFTLADESNQALDYGLSVNNLPQKFVASCLYALPEVKRFGFIGREALSGWQINGITTVQKGTPFNVLSNKDTNFDGIATDRPNVVGNPAFSGLGRAQKISGFFNTAAYSLPPTGQLDGNSRRNPLLGPGYVDTDISAFKRFAVYEKSDLLLRTEIFNTLNNVNLNAPNGTLGNANFGKITGAGAPRTVQVALKYEF